jgi:hypothetical protein
MNMSLIETNWNPSRGELRQFAGIWLPALFGSVGALTLWQTHSLSWAAVFWGAAAVVALVGLLKPEFIRPVFVAWMSVAYPVGWTISHLLLATIFYLVITPVGLVLRALGYDPMNRVLDRSAKTYWFLHEPGDGAARYFRQF